MKNTNTLKIVFDKNDIDEILVTKSIPWSTEGATVMQALKMVSPHRNPDNKNERMVVESTTDNMRQETKMKFAEYSMWSPETGTTFSMSLDFTKSRGNPAINVSVFSIMHNGNSMAKTYILNKTMVYDESKMKRIDETLSSAIDIFVKETASIDSDVDLLDI